MGSLYKFIGGNADVSVKPRENLRGVFLYVYGSSTCTSAAMTTSNVVLMHVGYRTMKIWAHGIASDTVINDYCTLTVYSAGLANGIVANGGSMTLSAGTAVGTHVKNGAWLQVTSGGLLSQTMVSGGFISAFSGAHMSGMTLYTSAYCNVSSGVRLHDADLHSSARVHVHSGGLLNGAHIASRASVIVSTGASAVNVIQSSGGGISLDCMFLNDSGTLVQGSNERGAFVYSNGVASNLMLYAPASCVLSYGAAAYDLYIGASASAFVLAGVVVHNAAIVGDSASLHVSSGGEVRETKVTESARMKLYEYGSASGGTVASGGVVDVDSRAICSNMTVAIGGTMHTSSGGYAAVTVQSGGVMYVSSGGSAVIGAKTGARIEYADSRSITMNPGNIISYDSNRIVSYVSSNRVSSTPPVLSGNTQHVFAGGTINALEIGSENHVTVDGGVSHYYYPGGKQFVFSGGVISSSNIIQSGETHISGGRTENVYLGGNGRMTVYSGGMAINAKIGMTVPDIPEATTPGFLTVSSGGGLSRAHMYAGVLSADNPAVWDDVIYEGGTIIITGSRRVQIKVPDWVNVGVIPNVDWVSINSF